MLSQLNEALDNSADNSAARGRKAERPNPLAAVYLCRQASGWLAEATTGANSAVSSEALKNAIEYSTRALNLLDACCRCNPPNPFIEVQAIVLGSRARLSNALSEIRKAPSERCMIFVSEMLLDIAERLRFTDRMLH